MVAHAVVVAVVVVVVCIVVVVSSVVDVDVNVVEVIAVSFPFPFLFLAILAILAIFTRYGVVAVRGAEVYELADEEGHLLNDPATQKERVSLR